MTSYTDSPLATRLKILMMRTRKRIIKKRKKNLYPPTDAPQAEPMDDEPIHQEQESMASSELFAKMESILDYMDGLFTSLQHQVEGIT